MYAPGLKQAPEETNAEHVLLLSHICSSGDTSAWSHKIRCLVLIAREAIDHYRALIMMIILYVRLIAVSRMSLNIHEVRYNKSK